MAVRCLVDRSIKVNDPGLNRYIIMIMSYHYCVQQRVDVDNALMLTIRDRSSHVSLPNGFKMSNSLLMQSALRRVIRAVLLLSLLWLAVFWALAA